MRLEKVPAKLMNHLLKSITWTDVDAAAPSKALFRRFVGRVVRHPLSLMRVSTFKWRHQSRRISTMAHWDGKEGRWGDRVDVNIRVRLLGDTFAGADGHINNLSLSGALVKAKVDFGLHSLIDVSITMPSRKRPQMVAAFVSRRLAEGVGIEWCEFAPIAIKDILRTPSIQLPL